MSLVRLVIISLIVFTSYTCVAQEAYEIAEIQTSSKRNIIIGDTVFILLGNCKNNDVNLFSIAKPSTEREKKLIESVAIIKKSNPLIKLHGNILYNFNYRSYIDTPFAQQDVMQHLVQSNINFTIKDKYPVKVILTNRSSNSLYFANATDVNIQFSQRQLLENIKKNLKGRVNSLVDIQHLNNIEQLYKSKQNTTQQLQAWISSPARVQELVEEREKNLRGNIPIHNVSIANPKKNGLDGFYENRDIVNRTKEKLKSPKAGFIKELETKKQKLNDSLKQKLQDSLNTVAVKHKDSTVSQKIESKKQELAKLKADIKKDEAKVKQLKMNVTDSISKLKAEINGLKSTDGLYAFMQRNNIAKDELTKAQQILLAIRQIGIGRSLVDYSELTVKNVSLSGFNIEVNPGKLYFAAAAGKINYRFRDFILKDANSNIPNQSLYLFRAGVGQKEKNNFIVTFYNGKKSVFNSFTSSSITPLQRVLGISAEARLALNENNYIVAEVAKSSYNTNGAVQLSSSQLLGKATDFKERTNEAYSIKLFSNYPKTDTKLTGYYKKIGENFQSFNLNPINVNQDAWMARVNQQFWKRRIMLDASIRKNDFNSPIAAPSFSTQTVFKSIQVSLRVSKYPFVSVGYYPSSQLSLSNNNVLIENQYNTLNALMSYSYMFKRLSMNTNAMYTRFYNSGTDTGFIYFNATNYTINHSIFLSRLTLQTSIALTNQRDINLFSAEQLLSYQFKKYITVGGAIKWNRLNSSETLIGGTANMAIQLKKIGTIQFNYDKTYLPGYNRTLLPVDMGRMTFYREF